MRRLLLATRYSLLATAFALCANAAPPYISYLYPAGAPRNTTLTITLGGTSLDDASSVWINGKGVTGKILEILEPTEQQIREAKRLDEIAAQTAKIQIQIEPDAVEGTRDLRIMTPEGLSNRFRFEISKLPEVLEKEPNSTPGTAQRIDSLPAIINGQITSADHDRFRFHATKGQTLLFDVQARALKPFLADAVPGWFQARIALYDSKQKLIAEADDFRFNPDPVLAWTVPETGDYDIEIWDAVSRGRADLVYRMRIGEFPFITDFYPLGAQRGKGHCDIQLTGINLGKNSNQTTSRLRVRYPADAAPVVQVGTHTPTGLTNTRPFEISNLPEIFEREPNDTIRVANQLTLPVTINGRISKPGDIDIYKFTATANQTLVFNLMARRLESPLDAKIRIVKTPGSQPIAQADDVKDERYGLIAHHADPYIMHTFKEDGTYLIILEDTQTHGGPEYAYRLHIAPPQPDFEVRVTPDNLTVPVGSNVVLKIKAIRIDKFSGPIELHVTGLPPGFQLGGAIIPEGKNETILTLEAPATVAPGIYNPRFYAEATINGRPVRREVPQAEELTQAYFLYHTVPVEQGYLIVTPPGPFTVDLDIDTTQILEIPLNTETKIPVRANRRLDWQPPQPKQVQETTKPAPKPSAKNKKAASKKAPVRRPPPNPSKGTIRVSLGKFIKGMQVTAAVLENPKTEGELILRPVDEKMVGQEGVLIIEATFRGRGTKTSATAPAIRYKILPAPETAQPPAAPQSPVK